MAIYVFGETNSTTYYHYSNRIFIRQFESPVDAVISEIQVHAYSGSGNVKVMVYDDNSGTPGSLLSSDDVGTAVISGQWNSISITPFSVSSGQKYWIGALTDIQGSIGRFNVSGGITEYLNATYSTWTAPSTWPGGTSSGYESCFAAFGQIYADYDIGIGIVGNVDLSYGNWNSFEQFKFGIGVACSVSVPSNGNWNANEIQNLNHFEAGNGVIINATMTSGNWMHGILAPFRGTLKKAMVFNRVLSDHEIKSLHNRALIG